ncbi:hypothetical protein Poli38472_001489 [Pythium oligandrum]|uniref:Lipoxygenase domain-containing protein n=1 Tax=Pythium oligandrum TaxID=41045 RepID=A0A8K1C720_PYTOL|nr:hypothetical protein Poli38472_014948 [Pythium oligandrum]TMW69333.1 hypothetical protein Poli38472_001489 [Pythium oligandrum]|eukprot:TMW57640.1 hypothetical protein Poli38472_014948 [Pythium oligandrum]
MADTHGTTVPIRVEALRNLAAEHPVRALIQRHGYLDFGLEALLPPTWFLLGTPMDQSFGWGAVGSVKFLDYYFKTQVSVTYDLLADLQARGIHHIPINKYMPYGTKLYDAIHVFVEKYVAAYYKSDQAVADDHELQSWASDCARVPQFKDFPAKITKRNRLVKLLTHLIYLEGVKHHAMNGATTWSAIALPYSTAALWKPMPTRKGEKIDLIEYTVPLNKMALAAGLAAVFIRPVPANQSWMGVYDTAPFTSESELQPAIAELKTKLQHIDEFIEEQESGQAWPYKMLRPSKLPYYGWI